MTSPVDKSREAAQALLALGLTREQAEFHVPSDEELARLIEQNTSEPLDSTRKAQIMDAIANDPATFERWMGLVETAHTLELGNFAADAAHVESSSTSVNEDSPSLLSQFVSFIGDHVRGLMAAGGAMGMAAVALVFLLPVGMDSRVSGLYDDYGQQWDSQPEQLDVIRGGKSTTVAELSVEDSQLKSGIQAGLALLGSDFRIRGIDETVSDAPTDSIDSDKAFALNAIGQIAAISHFKCSLGASDEYYRKAWDAIQAFAPEFETADDDTSKALSKTIKRQGNAETQVCRVSKVVVARVAN